MLYSCTFARHALHLGFINYASIVAHVYSVQYRANMKLVYSQGYTCMGNWPTKPRRFGKPQSAASQHFFIQSNSRKSTRGTTQPCARLQRHSKGEASASSRPPVPP